MSGEAPLPGRTPRFHPTEHLATEAVAAYVDGELRMNAYLRAAEHLAACPECSAEVDAQQQARVALRAASQVAVPRSLHDSLTRIPLAELPGNSAQQPAASHLSPSQHSTPRRNEAVFGFLTDSFAATRWGSWWRK